jgi:predicted transcriptional regulator
MKRGRKNVREQISPMILEILSDNTARSIHSLASEASKRLGRKISWNTVQKYLQELVETGKVMGLATPHSKIEGKDGLTVYALKK